MLHDVIASFLIDTSDHWTTESATLGDMGWEKLH